MWWPPAWYGLVAFTTSTTKKKKCAAAQLPHWRGFVTLHFLTGSNDNMNSWCTYCWSIILTNAKVSCKLLKLGLKSRYFDIWAFSSVFCDWSFWLGLSWGYQMLENFEFAQLGIAVWDSPSLLWFLHKQKQKLCFKKLCPKQIVVWYKELAGQSLENVKEIEEKINSIRQPWD